MTRVLLLQLSLLLACKLLNSQELPKSSFEMFVVMSDSKEEETIDNLLKELEKYDSASIDAAGIYSQLSVCYNSLMEYDSGKLYKAKAKEIWENADSKMLSNEFHGQYFLNQLGFARFNDEKLKLLDSASGIIKNETDRMYIMGIRWVNTSFKDTELYYDRFNELVKDVSVNEMLKGVLFRKHAINLLDRNMLDSANYYLSKMDSIQTTAFDRISAEYYKTRIFLPNNDYTKMRVSIDSMKSIIERYEIPAESIKSVYYYLTAKDYFTDLEQYDSAIYHLEQTLAVFKKSNNISGLATTYYDIARFFNKLENYSDSEESFLLAIKTNQSADFPNQGNLAKMYNGLISNWLDAYGSDESKKHEVLLKIKDELGEQEERVSHINRLTTLVRFKAYKGRYHTLMKQYEIAELELNSALRLYETNMQKGLESGTPAWIHFYLMELYYNAKKFDKVLEQGKHLNSSKILKSANYRYDVVRMLLESASLLGKLDLAKEYFSLLEELNDLEISKKTNLELTKYSVKVDLEKQRLINSKLELEKEFQADIVKSQRQVFIGLIVVLTLLIFLIVSISRVRKKLKLALKQVRTDKNELIRTNSELETSVYNLLDQSEKKKYLMVQVEGHISKIFNSFKGLRSFIPELGKLNDEQLKVYNRLSEIFEFEERELNDKLEINSLDLNRKIEIRRVQISFLIDKIVKSYEKRLEVIGKRLEVNLEQGAIFLGDQALIEKVFVTMMEFAIEHLDTNSEMIWFSFNSKEGLNVELKFLAESKSILNQTRDNAELDINNLRTKNHYLNTLCLLKELMDGQIWIRNRSEMCSVNLKLNLIELKKNEVLGALVSHNEIDKVYNLVVDYLVEKSGYANPSLNLPTLSRAIGVPGRKISFSINSREKTNFSKFLSQIRIQQVAKALEQKNYENFNLEGIAYEMGFNSKSTFFTAFKEFMGCTPKEYQDSLKNIEMA